MKIPPYLRAGDTIGITSPASYISMEDLQPSVKLIESWGFRVVVGAVVGQKDFTYGGEDEQRAADLQQMLDNPEIKAIMCARGGYGVVRIIDQLNFSNFVKHPKWIIGFSDITVLHSHIHSNFGIATLHSKMCNSFPPNWTQADPIQISTLLSIRQALIGEDFKYTAPAHSLNRPGTASGQLIGGNLSIIANLSGTNSALHTKGKILFIEDTGEYAYNIDRMLWNLKRTGQLSHLAGLIVGGFNIKTTSEEDGFGKSIYEIVREKVAEYDYPVAFDFPVGHQKNNVALKCGTVHLLEVDGFGSSLKTIIP